MSVSSSSSQNSGVSGRSGLPSRVTAAKLSRARPSEERRRDSQLTARAPPVHATDSIMRTYVRQSTALYSLSGGRHHASLDSRTALTRYAARRMRRKIIRCVGGRSRGESLRSTARPRRHPDRRARRTLEGTARRFADVYGASLDTWYDFLPTFRRSVAALDRHPSSALSRRFGIRCVSLGEWRHSLREQGLHRAGLDVRPLHEPRRDAESEVDMAITLNYGSNRACDGGGEPSEAGAWVAHAKQRGYRVTYWTVGNEVYGSWEYDLHAHPHDPHTYAQAVRDGYYPAVKAGRSRTPGSASSSTRRRSRLERRRAARGAALRFRRASLLSGVQQRQRSLSSRGGDRHGSRTISKACAAR